MRAYPPPFVMCGRVRVVSECRPLGVLLASDGFGGRSGRFLAGEVVPAVSFRCRSCRSSALGGTVAACVASCRVFLSLSAHSSGGVKKSLVGSFSGLSGGVAVSPCRSDARRGSPALF